MAMDIQQRTPQHLYWRNSTHSENKISCLNSTNSTGQTPDINIETPLKADKLLLANIASSGK